MSSSILTSYGHVGHSAEVKMHLTLPGKEFSIGQLGPDFMILDAPVDHPPSEAMLFFSIDGQATERKIRLPEGIKSSSVRVAMAAP